MIDLDAAAPQISNNVALHRVDPLTHSENLRWTHKRAKWRSDYKNLSQAIRQIKNFNAVAPGPDMQMAQRVLSHQAALMMVHRQHIKRALQATAHRWV